MILGISQMPLKNSIDHVKYFRKLLITHTLCQFLHEPIVGKFLQIIDNRILIGFPISPEPHQPLVIVNEIV